MADPTAPVPNPGEPPSVQWQLIELRSLVTAGFAKMDGRVESVEKEQKEHATRLTTLEVTQKISEKSNLDPTKILLALVALAAAALGGGAVSPFG